MKYLYGDACEKVLFVRTKREQIIGWVNVREAKLEVQKTGRHAMTWLYTSDGVKRQVLCSRLYELPKSEKELEAERLVADLREWFKRCAWKHGHFYH